LAHIKIGDVGSNDQAIGVRKDDTRFLFFEKCDGLPPVSSDLAMASFSDAENLWVPNGTYVDVLIGRVEEGKYLGLPILRVLEIELAFGVLATFVPILSTLKTIPPLSPMKGCTSGVSFEKGWGILSV
ncbi:unnamed protein product, partial [Prunus brigantina]